MNYRGPPCCDNLWSKSIKQVLFAVFSMLHQCSAVECSGADFNDLIMQNVCCICILVNGKWEVGSVSSLFSVREVLQFNDDDCLHSPGGCWVRSENSQSYTAH